MVSVAVGVKGIEQGEAKFFNEGAIAGVLLKHWIN